MNKKIMKKWMMVLAIVLCLNTVAFAEGEGSAPEPAAQTEQVKEEKKAEKKEEKKAEPEKKEEAAKPAEPEKKEEAAKPAESEKKEEAAKPAEPEKKEEAAKPAETEAKEEAAKPEETKPEADASAETAAPAAGTEVTADAAAPAETDAAAEGEAKADAEAAAPAGDAEQTGAATEGTEVGSEQPAADGTVEIGDYETPLGLAPDAATETEAPVPFTGNVKVELRNQGDIYYGDTVTLEANVTNANTGYDIRWEVDRHDGAGWSTIGGQNGSSYGFTITEHNAAYDYRVVLTTEA